MPSAHPLSPEQIFAKAIPDDERLWVLQAANVWFPP